MRKNRIRTLLAALLFATGLSATAFAETAIVTGSEVNVRSGPGSDYAILGSYKRGASVEVVGRGDGTWYLVDYNGTVGYMFADYLSLQSDSGSIVISGDAGQPTSGSAGSAVIYTGSQTVYEQTNGEITGMYVRFRSGPSGDSAILGEYNKGKAVTILGTEGDWTLCLIDGEYGYIYSQYVRAYAVSTAPSPAPTPTPTPVVSTPGIEVGQSGGTGAMTPIYGDSIVIESSSNPPATAVTPTPNIVLVTPTPAPAVGGTSLSGTPGTIAGDYVRFRRGPGTDYSIIRSYDHGQALTVLAVEGEWTYCSIEGETGYVFSQYVKTSSASSPAAPVSGSGQTVVDPSGSGQAAAEAPVSGSAAGSPGYIKGNNVRFRSGPDLSADIIGELYYGNVVTITGSDGTWTSIVCEGRSGYVFSQYVALGTLQPVASSGSTTGRQVADYALQFVGTPYHWGGVDPTSGFDCSGFAYYVYQHFGYTLNRVAAEQALNGRHVEISDMQPGDLLCFYSGSSYIGHVGIYVGNNLFVHAATSSTGVITSELTGYYARRGFEVRRILN